MSVSAGPRDRPPADRDGLGQLPRRAGRAGPGRGLTRPCGLARPLPTSATPARPHAARLSPPRPARPRPHPAPRAAPPLLNRKPPAGLLRAAGCRPGGWAGREGCDAVSDWGFEGGLRSWRRPLAVLHGGGRGLLAVRSAGFSGGSRLMHAEGGEFWPFGFSAGAGSAPDQRTARKGGGTARMPPPPRGVMQHNRIKSTY